MRVLIVESHADTAALLLRVFRNAGCEAHAVAISFEALRLSNELRFDLLIADIGLPEMDGWNLLSHVRRHTAIKAIAITGFGKDVDLASSRAAGFDVHLTKPVDIPHLMRTVEKLMGHNLHSAQAPADQRSLQGS
jgi:two-component system CheB/CheR fusion protein